YQMLAGRTPFEGDQAVGLLVQQIHDVPPHLRSIARAHYVPDPIADVVMANLTKDPKHREPDARALGQAVAHAAKMSGLSPDDFSQPLMRRRGGAIHVPAMERTKQLDLTPDLARRMAALPTPSPQISNGVQAARARSEMGATTKWEPPMEFQARLEGAI